MQSINTAIILDLDDTIFQTKSMDSKLFEPFFEFFTSNLKSIYDEQIIEAIQEDLWAHPWDYVINKYKIPMEIVINSITVLDNLPSDLAISTYEDYTFVKTLSVPKFLVTTGLTSLQKLKIKALNIENDFIKIVINDPFLQKKSKLEIFKELVNEFNLIPENIYVIGDNSDSEIKAGNELNMLTIQILKPGVIKGNHAQYHISDFNELAQIMNSK